MPAEDAEAAERIANAPKASGIEVWFDRNALRGGGAVGRTAHNLLILLVPGIGFEPTTRALRMRCSTS